jgi:DNA-binding MarR family transcriptional regulator
VEEAPLKRIAVRPAQDWDLDTPWSDIGRFAEAIMLARRQLLAAAQGIREEFALGPRGTWILGLVATGRIATQADVVRRYKVGRSIIAEEVALLIKAGLVACEAHPRDRRQIVLRVTKAGLEANNRMGDAMAARMAERLGRYTRADLLFCTGLLEDLARPSSSEQSESKSSRASAKSDP